MQQHGNDVPYEMISSFQCLSTDLSHISDKSYYNLCDECRIPKHEVANTEHELSNELESMLTRHPYVPSIYCVFDYHGQLQTSIQFTLRNSYLLAVSCLQCLGLRPPIVSYHRELFVLVDGATVGLDYASLSSSHDHPRSSKHHNSAGIVLIHHGLGGSSQSEYIIFQVYKLLHAGFEVIVMNARGCGGVPITSASSFAGDRSHDLNQVIQYLHHHVDHQHKRFYLIGYSLGGATSLKYMGSYHDSCPLTAAACVSPPWNLEVITDVFYLWSFLLAMVLKSYCVYNYSSLYHHNTDHHHITLSDILRCKDLHAMDELLVSSYGYDSVEEYRRAVSPAHVAQHIMIPTLSISSADDPICAIGGIPHPTLRGCGLAIIITRYGGHLGFPIHSYGGIYPDSWTEDVIVDWFKQHHLKPSSSSSSSSS